jgi:hypothetical protein
MSDASLTSASDTQAHHLELTVTYNGLDREVHYTPAESLQALLQHALRLFNITDNAHVMALWTEAGVELPVEGSVRDAGVMPCSVLVLRPSAVRGGCPC